MGAIQRAPQGLLDLLSLKDVSNLPQELLRDMRPTLDLLQFYGLQQRQVISNANAALAEGASVGVAAANAAVTNTWCVLFCANFDVVKTATMTALYVSLPITRGGGTPIPYAANELSPFGATVTGNVSTPFVPPYPLLLRPPWDVAGFLGILGTDATASTIIQAEIGVFG